ncbi:DUF2333 family protein [Modicisalibacter tunisiensis]|uniref:DUF2333 family protein n=1 Tax=Modicisalibacter tunisiensis TaxID=390637 RepID=A0ABS7X1X6_9GAMM|nr:DUF2333 family protein [Modicisalibacter tunisiensis]MBZ9568906.1 DUF2333 family protein [Modicisalibacter tunisiensis]
MALSRNRKRRAEVLERPEYGWIWKPLLTLVIVYLVVCLGLGIWWSQRPGDIVTADAADTPSPVRGLATVTALEGVVETLLDKPGGLLSNDVFPPGLWLDNMPSWEGGVLDQARVMAAALPDLSGQTPAALEDAQAALNADRGDWLYPGAERRYAKAVGALQGYQDALAQSTVSGFVGDGKPLAAWLNASARHFQRQTQHLLANVDDPDALRELGVSDAELPEATPWFRIDNVFYTARGEAWAFTQLLRATRRDYADLIASADAGELWERLIAELELAQRRVWSPVILNGSGFGLFANHSLVLANHTQAVAELARSLAARVQDVTVSRPEPSPAKAADQQTTDQPAAGQAVKGPDTPDAAKAQNGEAPAPSSAAPDAAGPEAATPEATGKTGAH